MTGGRWGDFVLAAPVVNRVDDLERLLTSAERVGIPKVAIADGDPSDDKRELFERDWSFDLRVLSPSGDGIAAARHALVEKTDADFLAMFDVDMVVPPGFHRLVAALRADDALGGIAGMLIEHGWIRAGATDFHEDSLLARGAALIQAVRDEKSAEVIGGIPAIRMDKLHHTGVFRRACLDDRQYDPRAWDYEHLDFFLGHYHHTDWEFALSPAIVVPHHTTAQRQYLNEHRNPQTDDRCSQTALDYIKEQYGYRRILHGERADLLDLAPTPRSESTYNLLRRHLPTSVHQPIGDLGRAVLR